MDRKKKLLIGAGVVTVILITATSLLTLFLSGHFGGKEQLVANSQTPDKLHTVARGEYVILIADRYGVPWESVLLENEAFLRDRYTETCGKLSQRYRTRSGRHGLFCNDRYRRPYGNTLLAGWQIEIPNSAPPAEIERLVRQIKGDEIAIVIDDTGSMSEDREQVGAWYMQAIQKYGKHIDGVYLYADHTVRKYGRDGNVEFRTSGGFENTFSALVEAEDDAGPDAIILITDEPGDDWDWGSVDDLPPVVAHCLDRSCEDNLERLAKETKGEFVKGI